MMYCVDVREKASGNTVETILETEDHDKAWGMVNRYNKEYCEGKELRQKYPIDKYFVDVYNDETR